LFRGLIETRQRSKRARLDGGGEVGSRRRAQAVVHGAELRKRDRARLEEPAQVGRKVGDG